MFCSGKHLVISQSNHTLAETPASGTSVSMFLHLSPASLRYGGLGPKGVSLHRVFVSEAREDDGAIGEDGKMCYAPRNLRAGPPYITRTYCCVPFPCSFLFPSSLSSRTSGGSPLFPCMYSSYQVPFFLFPIPTHVPLFHQPAMAASQPVQSGREPT